MSTESGKYIYIGSFIFEIGMFLVFQMLLFLWFGE